MATGRAGTLVDLSEASRNVLNLVKPQTTTSRADAGDNANADQLIQSLLASSKDDHQALIDSILNRSAIEFAPTRAAEIGSGGYNSSVGVQLQNEARARATGEATNAVLQKQTEDQRIAATLEAAKLQANRTQTVQPPTSIGGIVKSVGTAVVANKLFGAALDKTGLVSKTPTGNPVLGKTGQYDYSTTSEGASAYDSGTGAFSGNSSVAAEGSGGSAGVAAGGVSGSQPAIAGTSYGDFGGLSSTELDSILSGAGDAALGNSASFASLTDSSVPNTAAAAVPDAYGDFGTQLGSYGTAPAAGSGTLSGETAIAGGNGVVGGGAGFGATGSSAPGGASSLNNSGTGGQVTVLGDGANSSANYGDFGDSGTEANVLSADSSTTTAGGASGFSGAGASATNLGLGYAAGSDNFNTSVGGLSGLAVTGALPAYIAGTVATQVGGDFLETAFGGNNAGIIGDLGSFFSDAGGGIANAFEGTVICSELHRQGRMDNTTRKYNALWAYRNINHTALDGYRNGWGPVYVQLMRRSPLATKFASIVMSSWSARIRGKRTQLFGMVLIPLVWVPSWLLGKYLQKTRSTKVWI